MTDTQPTDTAGEVSTVSVIVNGQEIQARPDELLIDACERNGTYIPRFCHHPRMNPVGMCRMCLVEVDTGRGSSLQPSCMVPVSDNMKVETETEVTKKAQDGVLEFLLINHPLDCPVCDKGGECPLQDQTMAYGPGESRFIEEKRHFEKPIPISETVYLDRERCILCDRCTRFADEVAGDALIYFMDRGSNHAGQYLPRRAVRLLLFGQYGADLSGRSAHSQALSVQSTPLGPRRNDFNCLDRFSRFSHYRAVFAQSGVASPWC